MPRAVLTFTTIALLAYMTISTSLHFTATAYARHYLKRAYSGN
jgi:hypothetical protein